MHSRIARNAIYYPIMEANCALRYGILAVTQFSKVSTIPAERLGDSHLTHFSARQKIRLKRKLLKQRYQSLYDKLAKILYRHDPVNIGDGMPEDEYELEVSTILPRLKSATSQADLRRIIHEEFVRWFDASTAGSASVYDEIAAEVWQLLREN